MRLETRVRLAAAVALLGCVNATGARAATATPAPPASRPVEDALLTLWEDLGSEDRARAMTAVDAFAVRGNEAVAFVRARLEAVEAVVPAEIKRLIADLDSPEWRVRERASDALSGLGKAALTPLREALGPTASAEVRWRVQALLDAWDRGLAQTPSARRWARAAEAVQQIGTEEARLLAARLRGAVFPQWGKGAFTLLVRQFGAEALESDAYGTWRAWGRLARRQPDTGVTRRVIPPECWEGAIRKLQPTEVRSHGNNLVVVLNVSATVEKGLYIYLPISSSFPVDGRDNFTFDRIERGVYAFERKVEGKAPPATKPAEAGKNAA